MDKKVLNEIDRLEGIALACRCARPIVPMTGVLQDCDVARWLADELVRLHREQDDVLEERQEAEDQLADAQLAFDSATNEVLKAQDELDRLMASLSARLER